MCGKKVDDCFISTRLLEPTNLEKQIINERKVGAQ